MPHTERKAYGRFVIVLRYTAKGGTPTSIKVEGYAKSFPDEAAAKKWIDLQEAESIPPPDDKPRQKIRL